MTPLQELIKDIEFLRDRADEPLVKIAYNMAISVIRIHEQQPPKIYTQEEMGKKIKDAFNTGLLEGKSGTSIHDNPPKNK